MGICGCVERGCDFGRPEEEMRSEMLVQFLSLRDKYIQMMNEQSHGDHTLEEPQELT